MSLEPRILPSADIDEGAQIGMDNRVAPGAGARRRRGGPQLHHRQRRVHRRWAILGDHRQGPELRPVYEPAHLGDGVFIGPAAVLTNDEFPAP